MKVESQEQKRHEREELDKKYCDAIIAIVQGRKVTATAITYYDLVVELGLINENSDNREIKSAKNYVKLLLRTKVNETNPRIMAIPVAGGGWRVINASKRQHIQARQDWLNLMAQRFNAISLGLEPLKITLEATTETPQEQFTPILKGEQS